MPSPPVATQATTVLGDWYANFYDTRPQPIALCLSERSLLAVLVPFGDANDLPGVFRQAVSDLLTRLGAPGDDVGAEVGAMSHIAIGPTANRRVLGCLNEAAFTVSHEFDTMHERWLGEHAMCLSRFSYSTIKYRPPYKLAQELFRATRPDSRTGRAVIH